MAVFVRRKFDTSERLADMTSAFRLLLGALLLSATGVFARFAGSAMEGMETAENIQREQLDRLRDFLGPVQPEPATGTVAKREAPISFSNPRAKEFFVDGTKIPDGEYNNCYCIPPSFTDSPFSELRRGAVLVRLDAHLGCQERDAQAILLVRLFSLEGRARRPDDVILYPRFWPTNNISNVNDLLFWTNGACCVAWTTSPTHKLNLFCRQVVLDVRPSKGSCKKMDPFVRTTDGSRIL